MEIVTSKCILRQWRETDVDSLVESANNIKIYNNLRDIFPNPYTKKDAQEWISLNQSLDEKHQTNFAIDINGKVIGSIGLILKNDIYKKNIELGYFISEQYWGQGIATEAVKAITKYTFATFDCVRVYAEVFADNIASIRVLEKANFTQEGYLRQSIFKNNRFLDSYIYSVLKDYH